MRTFCQVSFATLILALLLVPSAFAQSTQIDKLYASDPSNLDQFGRVVALAGDIAVVGASLSDDAGPLDSGSAEIFVRSGGIWTREATLVSPVPTSNGYFGAAVAADGDTVMVGSPNARLVHVYERTAGTWNLRQTLAGTDVFPVFAFGTSIALAGDTAIIGASQASNGIGIRSGAAYVFMRDVSGAWSQQAKLVADDGEFIDFFGSSIALDGDSAIIGAFGDDSRTGAAYVFARSTTSGAWSQQAKLIANDGVVNDDFSIAVSIEGNTAAVASFRPQASVYVFTRVGTSWSQQPKLVAGDPGLAGAYSVDISGDLILFGAANDSRVFVFGRDSGNWSQLERLLPGDPAFTFGFAISVDGNTALIGAPLDDDFGQFSGSAFVFSLDFEEEPAEQLAALGTAVTDFGPGKSLADKIALAQMYLAVPDVQSACTVLTSFVNQVSAQRGKKLTPELADQLTADANVIMDGIGCN